MNRLIKLSLIIFGLFFLLLKLLYDLYQGATTKLGIGLSNDLINQWWPHYQYASDSVHSGSLPLWDPFISLGSPFFAEIGYGLFNPITWLIFLFDVPTALLIIQLLTVLIGVVGMLLYLKYLGLGWSARILSATIFGYAVFTNSFLPSLGASYSWFPVILLFTHRLLDRPTFTNVCLIAVALSLCFLAGFPNYFYYSCLILGVYFFIHLCFSWSEYGYKGCLIRTSLIIAAVMLMLGIVSIQLIPTYELSLLSVRDVSSSLAKNKNIGCANHSSGLMFANFFQSDVAYFRSNINFKIASGLYYLGGALLFLPFSMASKQHRKVSIALFAALVFITMFAESCENQTIPFLHSIPLASSLRCHGRVADYTQFLLIVMAGIGLSNAFGFSAMYLKKATKYTLPLFLVYASILMSITAMLPNNSWYSISMILCSILVVFSLFRAGTLSAKYFLGWIVAIIIIIDISVHRNNLFPVPAFMGGDDKHITSNIEWIKNKSDYYRALILPYGSKSTYRIANIGPKYGVFNINAYNGMTTNRWKNFIRYMVGQDKFDKHIASTFLGLFYGGLEPELMDLLSKDERIPGLTSLRYVLSEDGRHENLHALPRAYAVSHYVTTSSETESLAAIKNKLSTLSYSVILENAQPSFTAINSNKRLGSTKIKQYELNQIIIEADLLAPSIVVLTDSYYPGWTATIDGKSSTIFRANSLFRAVEVPPGLHTIVFKYQPQSLYWGLSISIVSILTMLALVISKKGLHKKLHAVPAQHKGQL